MVVCSTHASTQHETEIQFAQSFLFFFFLSRYIQFLVKFFSSSIFIINFGCYDWTLTKHSILHISDKIVYSKCAFKYESDKCTETFFQIRSMLSAERFR